MKKLDWLNAFSYAHRGIHDNLGDHPENSMPAFQNGIDAGCGLWMDIRILKLNIAIIYYDDSLLRLCKVKKEVDQIDFKALNTYLLGKSKEKIPRLDKTLRMVGGKVPVLLHLRSVRQSDNGYMVLLNTLLGYQGHVAIVSENIKDLNWFMRNVPDLPRAILLRDPARPLFFFWRRWINLFAKPDFYVVKAEKLDQKTSAQLRTHLPLVVHQSENDLTSEIPFDSCIK